MKEKIREILKRYELSDSGDVIIYTTEFNKFADEILALDWYPKEQEPEGVTAENSGLSVYELRLEAISDEIKSTESTLKCIGILREAMEAYAKSKEINLRDELITFAQYLDEEYGNDIVSAESKITEYLNNK